MWFLDAGANIGLFSNFISETIPDLKLYVFEPIPQIFEVLKANLKDNPGIKKIYNIGIADQERIAEFNYYPKVSADSTSIPFVFDKQVEMFVKKYRNGIAKIIPEKVFTGILTRILKKAYTPIKMNCPMKTVSQIIEENKIERIDLLKVDAENAERSSFNRDKGERLGKDSANSNGKSIPIFRMVKT